jgi:hypothetical protein
MRTQASEQVTGLAVWGLMFAILLVGFTTFAVVTTIATWSNASLAGL